MEGGPVAVLEDVRATRAVAIGRRRAEALFEDVLEVSVLADELVERVEHVRRQVRLDACDGNQRSPQLERAVCVEARNGNEVVRVEGSGHRA